MSSANSEKWKLTGKVRCNKDTIRYNNYIQNTGWLEKEEKDENPASPQYNSLRWVLSGYNTQSCPLDPVWVRTGNTRCITSLYSNGELYNTGEQEAQEQNIEEGSNSYNNIIWINIGENLNACPLPEFPPCDCSNYYPQEAYACIYGQCEEGIKIYILIS